MVVKIIPISRSIAIKPALPKILRRNSPERMTKVLTTQAMKRAAAHDPILLGSRVAINITIAMVEGPAIIGTAKGTIRGSPCCFNAASSLSSGKIILIEIKKRIIPPAIVRAGMEICMPLRI